MQEKAANARKQSGDCLKAFAGAGGAMMRRDICTGGANIGGKDMSRSSYQKRGGEAGVREKENDATYEKRASSDGKLKQAKLLLNQGRREGASAQSAGSLPRQRGRRGNPKDSHSPLPVSALAHNAVGVKL